MGLCAVGVVRLYFKGPALSFNTCYIYQVVGGTPAYWGGGDAFVLQFRIFGCWSAPTTLSPMPLSSLVHRVSIPKGISQILHKTLPIETMPVMAVSCKSRKIR